MPFNVLNPATAATAPSTTAGAPLTSVGETLLSLRTELALELGSRDDLAAARYNGWINQAYRNVAGMLTLKELSGSVALSLVSAQPFYLLPVQVASVIRLSISDTTNYPVTEGRELEMIDEASYRTFPVVDDESPTAYFRWRRMIVVYPAPDAFYTAPLDFRVRPDDMTADTHSPLLPQEFHEPILLSARYRGLRSLQLYADAATALNDFLVVMRPLINTDAIELSTQNAVVSPVKSGMGSRVWRR
jgi:hypothetical protein